MGTRETETERASGTWRHAPRVIALPAGLRDAGSVAAQLAAAGARALCLLDSAGGTPAAWSIVGFDPLPIALHELLGPAPTIAALGELVTRLAPAGGDAPPGPFVGGFLGALAYDLGVAGEAPPPRARGPLVAGGLYVDFVVLDHRRAEAWLVLGDDPGDARPPVAARRERWLGALAAAVPPPLPFAALGDLARDVDGPTHRARVAAVRERIAAGDFYQVNLAHCSRQRVRGSPLALYRRLRAVNPAPYAAYLAFDERTCAGGELARGALLSASPELLIEVTTEGGRRRARTRPIKGTAPRAGDPLEDARRAAELLASAKDLAELAMIVDLERNDLARVAASRSVRVERFPHLESYAGLHHLTADVVCELAAGRTAVDALAALFPGGSISGAPKLAAMAGISALEGAGRGFFSGSLGFLGVDGRAAWNILIRTIVWRDLVGGEAEASFHVGGGITYASDPYAEERETMIKAAKLIAALRGADA